MALMTNLQKNILSAREERMIKEKGLLKKFRSTLIVFSLNLPGTIPRTDRLVDLHAYGMSQLVRGLMPYENRIDHIEMCTDSLGPIGYISLDVAWEKVKDLTVDLEERDMYGRLFDIDVIQSSGIHIGRKDLNLPPRLCFICEEEAIVCRRMATHTAGELESYVGQLLTHFQETMNLRHQRVN